ncbi:MAG: PAS domain S-box protein [Nitrospirales bacterium]|nr:PAS domain S-box protein [Nitrospirales bacterium]
MNRKVSRKTKAHLIEENDGLRRRVAELEDTERRLRQTAERMYATSKRLMVHMEKAPFAVIERDVGCRIIRWSNEAERIFGWNARDVLGKSFDELRMVYEEDREATLLITQELLGGGRPSNVFLNRSHRRDRTIIYCEWYNSAVLDHSGALVSVLSRVLDVSERIRSEEERRMSHGRLVDLVQERTRELRVIGETLRREILGHRRADESLRLFKALVNWSNDAIYLVDPVTALILDCNDTGFRVLGYTKEELLQMKVFHCRTYTPFNSWERFIEELRTRGAMTFESMHRRRDGTLFPVEVNAKYVACQDKYYIVSVVRDIADRKRAEEERARLVAALESIADAIAVTDTDWTVQYVNPAFENVTGYSLREIVGRNLHLLKEDEQHGFYGEIGNTLLRGEAWYGRMQSRKKDGTLYEEDVAFSPIRGLLEQVLGYVTVKRDVTEKIRLETIAEAVNTMNNIGYIFSGIRHELGNPLNSMKTALTVLRGGLDFFDKEAVRAYLDRSLGEISRVEYLLKSLKNFNTHETLDLRDFDLAVFIEKFMALVKDDFLKKGIALTAFVGPGVSSCHADARALQQVLLNVLTNAADACAGEEDPRICITLMKVPRMVLLRIADTGHGMAEEQRKEIFNPFYTTKAHGTGLGLVIVRKMLSKMNGTIKVMSWKGAGTIVNILLPEGKGE